MWILLYNHFISCLLGDFCSTLGPTVFSGIASALLFCQICQQAVWTSCLDRAALEQWKRRERKAPVSSQELSGRHSQKARPSLLTCQQHQKSFLPYYLLIVGAEPRHCPEKINTMPFSWFGRERLTALDKQGSCLHLTKWNHWISELIDPQRLTSLKSIAQGEITETPWGEVTCWKSLS